MMFLEAEDDLEISAEAVPDELEVLRHVVHHGAQAGQASAHHCMPKKSNLKGQSKVKFSFLFKRDSPGEIFLFILRDSIGEILLFI